MLDDKALFFHGLDVMLDDKALYFHGLDVMLDDKTLYLPHFYRYSYPLHFQLFLLHNTIVWPIFLPPMVDQSVLAGITVVLRCHVYGVPEPFVSWFKNGMVRPRLYFGKAKWQSTPSLPSSSCLRCWT